MKQKINFHLGLVAMVAILATTIGITLVCYGIFQTQVRSDLKQNAVLLMDTEVFQSAYTAENKSSNALGRLSFDTLRITWIDEDGTVLFDNDTDITGLVNHLDRPEIQQAQQTGEGESIRRSDTLNMNTVYYALLLDNGTILRVSTQTKTIFSVFFAALPVIATIAVAILLGCVIMGHLLTHQLMQPLKELAENLEDSSHISVYRELSPFIDKIRSQHEKMLAAVKSRQDFTANITHELKTPIAAISGYAELIENRLIDEDTEVHIAQQIRYNADRLLSLIVDIIQLSELDHREIPRVFEPIDLFKLTKACVQDFQPMAEKKSIQLTCSGVSAGINADIGLIKEMVNNLIQNAIRYNKENGAVHVTVRIEAGHPILSVKDTGIGIPPEHQDRVFERFYRVDKSRSRQTGGTGLGLAIVKHIAEIHSAEIILTSQVGVGTEFCVRF